MAKSDIKTKATDASVTAFIDAVTDEKQRADAYKIAAMMERLSEHEPKMWGPSIIGLGSYHYKYESGREGDMGRIGFSPRKGQSILYIVDEFTGHASLVEKLGKFKTGNPVFISNG